MWCASLLFSVVIFLSSSALGQVEVDVPAECGSSAQFQAELQRVPGYSKEALPLTQVRIRPKDAASYELQVMQSGQAMRTFSDANCVTLFRTALVVAAASIPAPDSSTAAPTPSSEVEPTPASPLAAEPTTTPATTTPISTTPPSATLPAVQLTPDSAQPVPSQPEATTSEPATAPSSAADPKDTRATKRKSTTSASEKLLLRPSVGVAAGAAWGLSPSVAPLFEALGTLHIKSWGASLALRYVPPTQELTSDEVGMRVQSFGARAAALFMPTSWLSLQAGLTVYGMIAEGIEVRSPKTDLVWVTAPELELAGSPLQLGDFTAEFALQGRIALNRPVFQLQPDTEVYRTPRFGAAVLFRINWSPR